MGSSLIRQYVRYLPEGPARLLTHVGSPPPRHHCRPEPGPHGLAPDRKSARPHPSPPPATAMPSCPYMAQTDAMTIAIAAEQLQDIRH